MKVPFCELIYRGVRLHVQVWTGDALVEGVRVPNHRGFAFSDSSAPLSISATSSPLSYAPELAATDVIRNAIRAIDRALALDNEPAQEAVDNNSDVMST